MVMVAGALTLLFAASLAAMAFVDWVPEVGDDTDEGSDDLETPEWEGSLPVVPPAPRIHELGIFKRRGRINFVPTMARTPNQVRRRRLPAHRKPVRLRDFNQAQDMLLVLLEEDCEVLPDIDLRLSQKEGPLWTEVLVSGKVMALVPTHEVTSRDQIAVISKNVAMAGFRSETFQLAGRS